MSSRALHPDRGPHRPVEATPARAPRSARRTATMDSIRTDGLTGPLRLIGHSRDVVTLADGQLEVVGDSHLEARVEYLDSRRISELRSQPADRRLDGLVGASAASGFRGKILHALPDQVAQATRLHLLLDDIPVATLVSGHAVVSGGVRSVNPASDYAPPADLCSGWRSGGTIMLQIEKSGAAPIVTGPATPDLIDAGDPAAWHELPPLPPHGMRRARRLDVSVQGADVVLDSHFRDSHVDALGFEQTVHEYNVTMRLDRASLVIHEVEATTRVLPWVECPHATRSSERLLGLDVRELRPWVRAEMTGIDTCTHLNDQYRSMADAVALLDVLAAHNLD
ncbi:DUF2889 domain-containing protein [Aeromicrobium sp. S22]|nr:DUF2889 domain-containing protein [Aeromicrobium sp. S22]